MTKPRHLNSGKILSGDLPFSEAVLVGDMLYLSGQMGILPGTMKLAPGGIGPQSRQMLENVKTVLEAHGSALSEVVKCTIMLADIAQWAEFNEIYVEYFAKPYPARSAFGANGLALDGRVEMECIAHLPDG